MGRFDFGRDSGLPLRDDWTDDGLCPMCLSFVSPLVSDPMEDDGGFSLCTLRLFDLSPTCLLYPPVLVSPLVSVATQTEDSRFVCLQFSPCLPLCLVDGT